MPRRATQTPPSDERREERSRRAPDARAVAKIEHETDNEQALIAAAAVDKAARAKLVRALPIDGFRGKGHATIWSAIVELERQGLDFDAHTIARLSGGAADVRLLDAIVANRPEPPLNLGFHVDAFLWDKRRVDAAEGPLAELVEALQDPASEPDKIRALARRLDRAFEGASSLRFLRDPGAVAESAKVRLAGRCARADAGEMSHPYGIDGIDFYEDGSARLIPGREPRQMTLIAGASGNGKTLLANQIVLASVSRGERVLHGAWEQDAETNLQMLAAFAMRLSRSRLWTGRLSSEEREQMFDEMARISKLVRFFDLPFDRDRARDRSDRRARSINDVNLDVLHDHVEAAACPVAVFDLVAKAIPESKPEEEKRALDRLLGIAVSTSCHLISLHHLSKEGIEKRADRAPTREAIKGGTHWIDAHDTVLATHLPGVWKSIPNDRMEVRVLKQRYGKWPQAVELDYDEETGILSGGRTIPHEEQSGDEGFGAGGDLGGFLGTDRDDRNASRVGGRGRRR